MTTQRKIESFFRPVTKSKACLETDSVPIEDKVVEQQRCSLPAQEEKECTVVEISDATTVNNCSGSNSHLEESVTAFEKERMARIQRNMAIMKDLGLINASNSLSKAAMDGQATRKEKKRRNKVCLLTCVDEEEAPRRRSLRHDRGRAASMPELAIAQQKEPKENKPKIFEQNPDLLRYICDYDLEEIPRAAVENARTFKEDRVVLFDSNLVRCYSLDYWTKGELIVGGGKNGHASVFSLQKNTVENDNEIYPVVSQKLHRGWICDVRFIDAGDSCPKLLTAGNDGVISLWDISSQEVNTKKIKQQCFNDGIHQGGIFSMDYQPVGKKVLTGSKDGSVAITNVDDLRQILSFEDVHNGHVIKCVKWKSVTDSPCFLTSGNDGKTILHDLRSVHSRKTCFAASSVVNTLLWNYYDHNMFLSAGNDHLHVHDIRMEGQLVASLTGHNDVGSSGIYQPMFVNKGKSILTAGASKDSRFLTLFELDRGDITSRGDVGYSVGASMWCPARQIAFFSGPRKISPFIPCL